MWERANLVLLAEYNQWMNTKLYEAAAELRPEELLVDRSAFFGSIAGTLNHIVAGDTIWLRRFATHPARYAMLQPLLELPKPASLAAIHSTDLPTLFAHRRMLDGVICAWAAALADADLDYVLEYANMKGVVSRKRFGSLVLHFFNHQTHHRGQASTLLSQAGVDIGVTDLLALV
ncbi:MAG: DinB family protein [Pseudomonadota bacterium]